VLIVAMNRPVHTGRVSSEENMQTVIKLFGSMAAVVATALLLTGGCAAPSADPADTIEAVGCFNVRCGPTTNCSAICGDAASCVNGFCQFE
jgi:hypothetical protein